MARGPNTSMRAAYARIAAFVAAFTLAPELSGAVEQQLTPSTSGRCRGERQRVPRRAPGAPPLRGPRQHLRHQRHEPGGQPARRRVADFKPGFAAELPVEEARVQEPRAGRLPPLPRPQRPRDRRRCRRCTARGTSGRRSTPKGGSTSRSPTRSSARPTRARRARTSAEHLQPARPLARVDARAGRSRGTSATTCSSTGTTRPTWPGSTTSRTTSRPRCAGSSSRRRRSS